jgi:hypothetical protein
MFPTPGNGGAKTVQTGNPSSWFLSLANQRVVLGRRSTFFSAGRRINAMRTLAVAICRCPKDEAEEPSSRSRVNDRRVELEKSMMAAVLAVSVVQFVFMPVRSLGIVFDVCAECMLGEGCIVIVGQ